MPVATKPSAAAETSWLPIPSRCCCRRPEQSPRASSEEGLIPGKLEFEASARSATPPSFWLVVLPVIHVNPRNYVGRYGTNC